MYNRVIINTKHLIKINPYLKWYLIKQGHARNFSTVIRINNENLRFHKLTIKDLHLNYRNYSTTQKLYQNASVSKDKTIANSSTSSTENTSASSIENTSASSIENTSASSSKLPDNLEYLSSNSSSQIPSIEYIPPPPAPPEFLEETVQVLNSLGEPTFQSLGLANWTPPGFLQWFLENLHVHLDIPWWGAIAITTAILRFCLFPVVVKGQKNVAKMANEFPKMQIYQDKITEARVSGNSYEVMRLSHEMQTFMKEKGINPIKNVLVPLAQAPIFISMFFALRSCASLPVESFKSGGMLWFTDLTVSDPYFILPVITSATLFLTLQLGADGQKMAQAGPLMGYVFKAIPIVFFPFMMYFPSAVLCYWVTTNFLSLGQVGILKIPAVKKYFGIPEVNAPPPPKSKKGFVKSMKESYSNMQVAAEIADRARLDDVRFKKSGIGPLVKTYKHNPLTQKPPSLNIQAKAKD